MSTGFVIPDIRWDSILSTVKQHIPDATVNYEGDDIRIDLPVSPKYGQSKQLAIANLVDKPADDVLQKPHGVAHIWLIKTPESKHSWFMGYGTLINNPEVVVEKLASLLGKDWHSEHDDGYWRVYGAENPEDIEENFERKLDRILCESVKYIYFNTEEEPELAQQAYDLGKTAINVLIDKEPILVAMDGDKVVGVLFTSMYGDNYSFDVVVDPAYRSTGKVGVELTKTGLQEYQNLAADMPEINLQLDVVNPKMQTMLEKMGLHVLERISGDRVVMGYPPE